MKVAQYRSCMVLLGSIQEKSQFHPRSAAETGPSQLHAPLGNRATPVGAYGTSQSPSEFRQFVKPYLVSKIKAMRHCSIESLLFTNMMEEPGIPQRHQRAVMWVAR